MLHNLIKPLAIVLAIVLITKILIILPVGLAPFALIGLIFVAFAFIPFPQGFRKACEDFHHEYHGWDPEDFE